MKYAESILNRARDARAVAARELHPTPQSAMPAAPAAQLRPVAAAEPLPPARHEPQPPVHAEGSAGSKLIVGPNIKLKGVEIDDCDTLVVEGRVEATMVSRSIQISEKGSFNGKVDVDVAEIRGTFQGEMTARTRLVVHSGGRVTGKIRYGRMLVQEGGEMSGDVGALGAELAMAKSCG